MVPVTSLGMLGISKSKRVPHGFRLKPARIDLMSLLAEVIVASF